MKGAPEAETFAIIIDKTDTDNPNILIQILDSKNKFNRL